MKTFTVNGKEYKAKEIDLNALCDLEDMGVALEEIPKKNLSAMRAYFAICAGESVDYAGRELEEHYLKERSLENVSKAMSEAFNNSDFFRALIQTAEKKTVPEENEEKKKEKNTEH